MAEPIYKFFMGRFLEPWYQLSKEEQDSLQAKLRDAKKKFGCTQPIVCNSSWSSDLWSFRTSKRSRSTWRPFRS